MGAGAGYNIKGTIDADSIKINSFEVEEPYFTDGKDNVFNIKYQIIPIKCDIDCKAEDVSSEAYYDGGTLRGLTPIKITGMSLIPYSDDIEDISEITEDTIWYALRDLKFDVLIGGGWSHHTFDGDISCGGNDLKEDSYSDFYFNDITMHITNKYAIDVLDEYAAGDNYEIQYSVVDINDEVIMDDFYTGELDEAIEYAKENNRYQVTSERRWYRYAILDNGDIDIWDFDIEDYNTVEWTNPNYIEEDY